MESVIIEEMRAFMRLDLNPRQKQYFADTIAVAKRVDIVRAADVFNDYELEIIRDILKPQPQQCYRNAHLLCQLFPERVRYCEGKTFAFIPKNTHLTGLATNTLILRLSLHYKTPNC